MRIAALPVLVVASSLLSLSVTAYALPRAPKAKTLPPAFSLTPTVGGMVFGGASGLDAAPVYGLKLAYDIPGKNIIESINIEGTINYFSTRSDSGSNATGYLVRLDAMYPFLPGGKWDPFVGVGAGGMFVDKGTSTQTSPLLNYGLGLKYQLRDNIALRCDARHLLVYNNANTRNDFELTTGVTYYFGRGADKVVPVKAPATTAPEKKPRRSRSSDTESRATPPSSQTPPPAAARIGKKKDLGPSDTTQQQPGVPPATTPQPTK